MQLGESKSYHESSLIISEFVGCSPSMSGAIRVNPWSIDDVSDGIYSAITMSSEGILHSVVPQGSSTES